MKQSVSINKFKAFVLKALSSGAIVLVFAFNVLSQAKNPADTGLVPSAPPPPPEDNSFFYSILGTLFFGSCIGVLLWMKSKKKTATQASQAKDAARKRENNWDSDALDGDKEMEWLRKNSNIINKKRPRRPLSKTPASENAQTAAAPVLTKEIQLAGASDLPFNSILRLEYPIAADALPASQDMALHEAIEQVLDEFNEDEEMKEVSMRIVSAYKTRNSVETLSQVALYDLSVNMRCKAIEVLGEFDHQSVFETVILACADPTREVRAAAARVLTRLGFSRSDAWARIALLEDHGRMRQIARAAIEGGLVDRYFDRLTHSDYKQAYEAFALFTLLMRAGEMEPITSALLANPNATVKLAVLHMLRVNKETKVLPLLQRLAQQKDHPKEVLESLNDTIEKFSPEEEPLEVVYQPSEMTNRPAAS